MLLLLKQVEIHSFASGLLFLIVISFHVHGLAPVHVVSPTFVQILWREPSRTGLKL